MVFKLCIRSSNIVGTHSHMCFCCWHYVTEWSGVMGETRQTPRYQGWSRTLSPGRNARSTYLCPTSSCYTSNSRISGRILHLHGASISINVLTWPIHGNGQKVEKRPISKNDRSTVSLKTCFWTYTSIILCVLLIYIFMDIGF